MGGVRRKLLILTVVILSAGCDDEDEDSWYAVEPVVLHQANGFTFSTYGPRDTGWAPDLFPSLDAGLVTLEEIGQALEVEARELARKSGLDEDAAVAELRGLEIRVVDDYNFDVSGIWASGLYTGRIYVALWARTETADSNEIPAEAPRWTTRSPDSENVNWRHGGRPLVPATDHELGHHYFGPKYEH